MVITLVLGTRAYRFKSYYSNIKLLLKKLKKASYRTIKKGVPFFKALTNTNT